MKKLLSTLIITFIFLFANAQDYEITFVGAGASSTVDSVLVENLTQGTSIKLSGIDTLFLTKITTGINSFSRGSNLPLRVYPNPFSSECKIEFSTQKSESITIRIFDLSGRLTTSKVEHVEQGNHHFQISEIPQGMYIVQVRSASLFQTAKVLSYNQNFTNPEIKYQGRSPESEIELIEKSGNSVSKLPFPYMLNDNLLLTALSGRELFLSTLGFRSVYPLQMTENPEIEDNGPIIFVFVTCIDPDGREYSVVKIEENHWMAENYAYKTENGSWIYDDDESKLEKYGRLYTWETAKNNAPDGWHLPSEEEWDKLTNYTVDEENIGTAMKNSSGWLPGDNNIAGNGTNSSGFSVLPGGARFFVNGTFYNSGEAGYWWSNYDYSDSNAMMRKLSNTNTGIGASSSNKEYGFSVRYIRDAIPIVTTHNVMEVSLDFASMRGSIDNDRGSQITECGIYWSKTNQFPDANDSIETIECLGGLYGIYVLNLEPNTTYYYRAFATNNIGTSTGAVISFTTSKVSIGYGDFNDERDTKTYNTVTLGDQTWMAENLAYLPQISPSSDGSYTSPFYYVFGYEGSDVSEAKATTNFSNYGVLYNWEAAKTACPAGWHLPSDSEWNDLINFLTVNEFGYNGSGNDIAKSMASTSGWENFVTTGTIGNVQSSNNRSGFNALPGGARYFNGGFGGIRGYANFWSSTPEESTTAWDRNLDFNFDGVSRGDSHHSYGYSVRCVKD